MQSREKTMSFNPFGSQPANQISTPKTQETVAVVPVAEAKLSLNLWINKEANKVLFAEVGPDFVDFLFNLFSHPFGQVVNLVKNCDHLGVLGSQLYKSLESFNDCYLIQKKDLLLKPYEPKLGVLSHKYVKSLVLYMVTDDLSVKNMTMVDAFSAFAQYKGFDVFEKKVVQFGKDEALMLLKSSLKSNTVLTDIFLTRRVETEGVDLESLSTRTKKWACSVSRELEQLKVVHEEELVKCSSLLLEKEAVYNQSVDLFYKKEEELKSATKKAEEERDKVIQELAEIEAKAKKEKEAAVNDIAKDCLDVLSKHADRAKSALIRSIHESFPNLKLGSYWQLVPKEERPLNVSLEDEETSDEDEETSDEESGEEYSSQNDKEDLE